MNVCLSVYAPYMYLVPLEAKNGCRSPGTGVSDDCEPLVMFSARLDCALNCESILATTLF